MDKKKNKKIFNRINFKKSMNNAKENFIDILNLPKELSGNYSKITMIENNELLIEGETSVVDYYDNYIKIKCSNIFMQKKQSRFFYSAVFILLYFFKN